MNEVLRAAKAIEEQILQDRREIHRHPEVGFDLQRTAAYVQKRLKEMNIDSRICGGPISAEVRENFAAAGFPDMSQSTGVVAVIGQGEPCILLRADMDALPMEEAKGQVEFASRIPGAAHMCGHDSHTAMLLGAAKLLKDREDQLKGSVKLMFQTGEECGCGSRFMIENGVMEEPRVDAALAIHVMSQQPVGTVQYSVGIASAAMDTFLIRIQGKGGHSSMPQASIDPLMIANQLYTTLNLLTCREIDPRETVALTAGKCGGGTAANVIPDTAELMVGVRTFQRQVREHLLKRIPEIIDHTVTMWRGQYTLHQLSTPSTYTDEGLCKEMVPIIQEIVGEEQVSQAPCMAGTEDFGYVTEQVPGMFLTLGAGNPSCAPMHNPGMVLDESVFAVGAAVYANCAIQWLNQQHK